MTTLGIGGPARFFARAGSESAIVEAFDIAARRGLRVFVLGGGSNLLVADRGFDGLVVQVSITGIAQDGPMLTAGAGEQWDDLVALTVEKRLAGFECLSGIPGFVGGTPIQNVGAYGQEVSETIVSVRCFDRTTNDIVELRNSECGFRYRTSIFNSTERDRYVVSSVTYKLSEDAEPMIEYKDLKKVFVDRGPTLAEARDAVLRIRRSKSMVIDPADPNSRSAGSFFKNPIVDKSRFDEIASRTSPDQVPSFPAVDSGVKIPAAWLIEQAGFAKGFRLGNVGISENHSLALINRGGGSAADIIDLKEKIQNAVQEKFDILLQHEPVFVGFD